jgi:hypothetical protein
MVKILAEPDFIENFYWISERLEEALIRNKHPIVDKDNLPFIAFRIAVAFGEYYKKEDWVDIDYHSTVTDYLDEYITKHRKP